MVQLYLLPLLASPLVRASIAGGDWKNSLKPTGPVEENTTVKPCYYWVNDAVEEDCDELKKTFNITDKELMGWNRSLGPNCSGWKKGNSYCLNIPPQKRPTVTQAGSTATGLSQPSANMHWNPPVSFHIPVWSDKQAVKAVTSPGREPPRPTVSPVVSMMAPIIRPDGAEHSEPRLGDPTWTIWPTPTSDPIPINKAESTGPSSYLPPGGDRKPPIILPGPGEFPPGEFTKPSEHQFPTAPLSVPPVPSDDGEPIPINKPRLSGLLPGDFGVPREHQLPKTTTLEPALPIPTEGEVSVDLPKVSGIPSGKPIAQELPVPPILEPVDPSEGDRIVSVDLPGQSGFPPEDYTKPIGDPTPTDGGAVVTHFNPRPTDVNPIVSHFNPKPSDVNPIVSHFKPKPTDIEPVVTHFNPKPTGEPPKPFTPPLDTVQNGQKPEVGLDVPCKENKRTLRRGTRIVESLDIEKREQPFDCSTFHVAHPGDSCKSVAEMYGISTDEFMRWNNIGPFCEGFSCGNNNFYCVTEPTEPY